MTNHTHVSTPAPLDTSDPRLQGPSREALVRAWPVIMRQVAVCEARLAREAAEREREGRTA
jgi:hypothetical protein